MVVEWLKKFHIDFFRKKMKNFKKKGIDFTRDQR